MRPHMYYFPSSPGTAHISKMTECTNTNVQNTITVVQDDNKNYTCTLHHHSRLLLNGTNAHSFLERCTNKYTKF